MSTDFVSVNMQNWDERVTHHLDAYGAQDFAADPEAVRATKEAELLAPFLPEGSFDGLDMVHLQCHIGIDTISFARRGARVVGTDISGEAISAARVLAESAGTPGATFVQCRNEDAPGVLGRTFDVVFTSVGVLAWLGDLSAWAETVAKLLRPGGVFLVYDAHPMLNAMEYERDDDLLVVGEPYFHAAEPKRFDDGVTYAGDALMSNAVTYQWPHDLAEILSAILHAGLRIETFDEHEQMPWKALPNMNPTSDGWVLPASAERIPLMFSLVASKR